MAITDDHAQPNAGIGEHSVLEGARRGHVSLRGRAGTILRDLYPPPPNPGFLSSSRVAATAMTVGVLLASIDAHVA